MAWFRKTAEVTTQRDPRPARYVGFAPGIPYLYEFTTAEGGHVNLHDAAFESLRYDAGSPPTVIATFIVDDEELRSPIPASPRVINSRVCSRFTDAFVISWDSNQEDPEYRSDRTLPHGQVHDFNVYEGRCFAIQTIDDEIYIEATSLEVGVEPMHKDEVASTLARIGGRG